MRRDGEIARDGVCVGDQGLMGVTQYLRGRPACRVGSGHFLIKLIAATLFSLVHTSAPARHVSFVIVYMCGSAKVQPLEYHTEVQF